MRPMSTMLSVWLFVSSMESAMAALCDDAWKQNECPKYCQSSLSDKCCAHKDTTAMFLIPNWGGATKGIKNHADVFKNCTGGSVAWGNPMPSKPQWPYEVLADIGTDESAGPGNFDGYFIKTVWFPSYSTRLENLNDRIRNDAAKVAWMDINMQARVQVTWHGDTKGLPYEADFVHLLVRRDLIYKHATDLKAKLGLTDAQWDPDSLPQTYEDLATMSEYFNGLDLNNDSIPDYGLCWPIQDYAWVFQFMGIYASKVQYLGKSQGVFFDTDSFKPLVDNPAFRESLRLFRQMIYSSHTPVIGKNSLGESNKLMAAGRCAFYLAKRGGLKYIAIRKVQNGDWQPTHDGQYWAPERVKPPGSIQVYDREAKRMKFCTAESPPPSDDWVTCPSVQESTDSVRGTTYVVNRAPFFSTGVLASGIRAAAEPKRKDLLWDFILYTNVADQSTKYVSEISTWDTFRKSQSDDRDYFLNRAKWGESEYNQMRAVVSWGLSASSNSAVDLRVKNTLAYEITHLEKALVQFCFPLPDSLCKAGPECECRLEGNDLAKCKGSINTTAVKVAESRPCVEGPQLADEAKCGGLKSMDETVQYVYNSWESVTEQEGRLRQLRMLRRDLGLPLLGKTALCKYHFEEANAETPGTCFDERNACPAGQFRDGLNCTKAPPGTYAPAGMVLMKPLDCAAGSYTAEYGSDHCKECQPGKFQGETGKSGCSPCAVGHYAPQSRAKSCQVCDLGTVAPESGSKSCLDCPTGEYQDDKGKAACKPCPVSRVTFSQGAKSNKTCVCGEGMRAMMDAYNSRCVACMEGLQCKWTKYFTSEDIVRGLAEVKIQDKTHFQAFPEVAEGYWSDASIPKTEMVNQLYKCTSIDRCPGGAANTCAPNMEDVNCGKCSKGYFHNGETCKDCGSSTIMLILFWVLGFLIIGILVQAWNRRAAHTEIIEGVLASITVAIMINFVQTLGILGHLNFDFPIDIKDFFNVFDFFLFDMDVLRPSCALNDTLAATYFSVLIMPVFVLGSCLVWFALSKLMRRCCASLDVGWDATVNTMGLLLQVLFISMTMAVLSIWECTENPSGKRTLKSAPYTICYESEHVGLMIVGGVLCILYILLPICLYIRAVVLLPTYIFDKSFATKYKSVYFKFNPCLWWFGFFHMCRSLLLAIVPVIVPDDNFTQYLLMLSILIGFSFLHLKFEPYVDRWANNLETYESGCIIMILLLCSWFIRGDGTVAKNDIDSSNASTLATIIVIIVASCILGLLIVTIYALCLASRPQMSKEKSEVKVQGMLENLKGIADTIKERNDKDLANLLLRGTFSDYDHMQGLFVFFGLEVQGKLTQEFWSRRLGKAGGGSSVSDQASLVRKPSVTSLSEVSCTDSVTL